LTPSSTSSCVGVRSLVRKAMLLASNRFAACVLLANTCPPWSFRCEHG
jgi:hypothetical protein